MLASQTKSIDNAPSLMMLSHAFLFSIWILVQQRFLRKKKVLLVLVTIPSAAIAEGDKKAADSGWESTVATGASFSSGNSDSLAFNLQFLATYRDDDEDAEYGADYFFSQNEGETTNNSLRLFGHYNRNITDRFYLGLGGSLLTNEASDLDYRLDVSPVLGYYFFRDDKRLLSLEFGPGYAFESKGGVADSFLTMRLAQNFDYKWTETATLRQSAALTPKAENAETYIFEFQAGVDLRVSNQWDLRTRLIHRIDLDPGFGLETSDTLLTVGLAYSLNGFLKQEEKRSDERKSLKPDVEKKEGTRMGWVRNIGLGVSTTKGNSDTFNTHLDYETIFRSKEREFFFKTNYRYGANEGQTTAHRLSNNTRYNWKFDDYLYAGIGSSFLHDDFIDLSYRISPGAHVGRYLILTDKGGFSLEGGLGYTLERQRGIESNELSINAAQRLYWQVGDHTYITQEIAYDAPLNDPGNFNINSYFYLDTILSDKLAWRVGMEYYYSSQPAAGKGKYDATLSTGISLRF